MDDVADRRGSHENAVVVVVHARIVFVPRTDKFGGVAREEKILEIDVSQYNLLMAALERVEPAVRVFLEKLKIHGVVLDAVALPIAKDAQAGLFIGKKKASEVGIELLNARASRDEIVVVAEVAELHFDKGFLQAGMIVKTVGAAAHVRAHDAKLANVEIVEAELRRDANTPIDWFEGRIAVEKIEAEAHSLIEKSLLASAKKTRAAGLRGTNSTGRRDSPAIEECFRRSGDVQENLLAKNFRPDGFIAFETIAIERVVPVRFGVEVLALLRIAAIVRLIESPAIGNDVVNISDRRQVFRRKFRDVIGIGIEPMTKFAMAAKCRQ